MGTVTQENYNENASFITGILVTVHGSLRLVADKPFQKCKVSTLKVGSQNLWQVLGGDDRKDRGYRRRQY